MQVCNAKIKWLCPGKWWSHCPWEVLLTRGDVALRDVVGMGEWLGVGFEDLRGLFQP